MKISSLRYPIILLAIIGFLAALWAGWLRLGWAWPVLSPALPGIHGALMVSAFLGTLVALERAFALNRRWMYAAPALSGLGGLLLILGAPAWIGALLITLGSLVLVAIFVVIVRTHLALYTVTMAIGAACWLAGNLLWLGGWSIYRLVLWWAAFLILTIAGERLELGRVRRLPPSAGRLFIAAIGLLLSGVLVSVLDNIWGARVAGLGMLCLAFWFLSFDIARKTIRQDGLPRFVAVALLAGFVWLGISGLIAMIYGGTFAGAIYDATLHAIFVGFVISMIFGHAPIIFPSLLGRPIRFWPGFYAPLILLHASLVMRILGDLVGDQPLRLWGGLLNGIAILLYFLIVGISLATRPDHS
jgi:hypothetical protein